MTCLFTCGVFGWAVLKQHLNSVRGDKQYQADAMRDLRGRLESAMHSTESDLQKTVFK